MVRADLSAVNYRYCMMCKVNRHGECDHHMNDGAVDADEFIHVTCECPCQGDVGEGRKLIDLVGALRDRVKSSESDYRTIAKRFEDEQRRRRQLVAMVEGFIDRAFDDEGELLELADTRNWRLDLERLKADWDEVRPLEPSDG